MTFNEIIENKDLEKYIYFATKRMFENTNLSCVMEFQDMHQEVLINIHNSLSTYDSNKGTIKTWIGKLIEMKIKHTIRQNKMKKRDIAIVEKTMCIDTPMEGTDLCLSDFIEDNNYFLNQMLDNDKATDLLNYILSNTKYQEDKDFIIGSLNGLSHSEVCRLKNYSHSVRTSSSRRIKRLATKYYEVNKLNLSLK